MTDEEKKKKLRRRKWKIIIYFIAGISLIVLVAPVFLNKIIEKKLKEQLNQLAPLARVSFSSVHVDLFASSISINDLSVKIQPNKSDLSHYHLFNYSKADLTGINFFDVLLHKKALIDKIKLRKGEVELDQFLLHKKDSSQYDLLSRLSFKNISINHFETSETNVWTHANQEKKWLLQGRIKMDSLRIQNPQRSSTAEIFHFNAVQCNASNINYRIPSSPQAVQIKQLLLDSRKEILQIDSLNLISEEANSQSPHAKAFIASIHISNFDVLKLADKKLIAGTIIVDKSNAHIFSYEASQKNPKSPKGPIPPLNKFFDEIRIGRLVVSQAAIKLHSKNINQCKIREMEIAGLNKSFDSSLRFTSFTCSISDIRYAIPHVYRTLYINSLNANSKKKIIRIADAKITTQYSKFEYGKKLGRQADYIDATIPLIEISGVDFKQLIQKKLVANKIMIDKGKFYFFRDRRLPRQLKEQPMPNDYVKMMPLEVRVRTFKISNSSAVSEEFPKIGNQSGYIAIYQMNISMSPMLNHPGKNDPVYSYTHVEGSIMNAGLIKATIRAPLRKNIYVIDGDIENLDLPRLNPSAENLGRFHIESGILNSLYFYFTATEEKATGKIVGEYHNLVIDRLKEKKGEKKVAKLPSFFLRHVIIPKNKDKSLRVKKRTGKIDYDRDPTRLVTFYFLKSLLDGIRASFTLGFLLPE